MEALRDPSCLRDLLLSSPLERFGHGRFAVTAVAPKSPTGPYRGRYKYRLFFFIGQGARPTMAVDLESDILGTWRMTATTQAGTRIVASFDEAPEYEAFKALALGAADAEAGAGSSAPRGAAKEASKAPRGPGASGASGAPRDRASGTRRRGPKPRSPR